jgi:CHAT domain-containing protein
VLLEDYALAVVPNGPALLDGLRPRDRRPAAEDGLLTVGGVAYDTVPEAVVARADARGVEPHRAAERGAGITWGALSGTGPEAERVAALAAPRKVLALTGAEAGTARLQAQLPKARWAHLATHGFFADKAVRSAFQLDERLYERNTRDRATPGARSPLVLSGLVLAGANKPDPAGDGGILTAEAIVGLDLSGLDLAVLSACETGLGEVAGGEGVYGLQRAFHQAGCRDVVASLWRVNDEATAALMAVFYRKLWQENLPPVEALR